MTVSKDKISSIPTSTGVYVLKDQSGKTLYIGKAKNLRSRVRSYFAKGEDAQRPQIRYLMRDVADLDYLVTKNEREALMLENSLIKQKKPKYNIRLRDDKNYLSLRMDPREKFPRLSLTRRVVKDGALYYGPFSSAGALKRTKKVIHKIFPLRDCKDEKFRRHAKRPCLSYYMGLCLGPCAGKVGEGEYREVVESMKLFLRGEKKELGKLLKVNMEKASEEMRYEDAAAYRDQINLLQKNLDGDMLVTPGTKDMDILGFYREEQSVEFSVLFMRGGALIDKVSYSFKNAALKDDEVLGEFISRFYEGNRFIPSEIVIPFNIDSKSAVSDWLSEKQGRKVRVETPKRGARVKKVELANRNALETFQRKHAEDLKDKDLLERLKSSLHLNDLPESIECYDISNIQGTSAVASAVRFENGEPAKDKYRKYKIKTVEGPNDYAMMSEVLERRFKRAEQEGWELPELILVDGGKGQLNIAQSVISELGYEGKVALASIAKGRAEGESDKIYIYGRKNPILFSKNSKALFLLMRIRDEAHRFAITYHKKLRGKRAVLSELDGVPGIGPKRKKELIKKFGTVSKIRNADIDDISSVPGFNAKLAGMLKDHLSG